MELARQLPAEEQERLFGLLTDTPDDKSETEGFLTEQRFSGGRICPLCGGIHVQRNGHRKSGAQKSICRDCGKTFSITKDTVFSGTRKGLSVWRAYMGCMAEGLSIDKSAERCDLSHRTAFTWRHKILDAIGRGVGKDSLSGIVEADETFLPISYKRRRAAFK